MDDRRRSLLVNAYEMLTGELLVSATTKWGAGVAEKVRVADAVSIANSGLGGDEYEYALKAHFDFVVVERDDHRSLFAVEFDGPHHQTDPDARRRDALKESICEKLGMPLVRVGEEHLPGVLHEPMLGWLVDVWFLARAFEPVTGQPFNYRLTKTSPGDRPDHIVTFVPEARRTIFDFLEADAGGAQVVAVDPDGKKHLSVQMWFPSTASHDDPNGDGFAQWRSEDVTAGSPFAAPNGGRPVALGPPPVAAAGLHRGTPVPTCPEEDRRWQPTTRH